MASPLLGPVLLGPLRVWDVLLLGVRRDLGIVRSVRQEHTDPPHPAAFEPTGRSRRGLTIYRNEPRTRRQEW